MNFAVDGSARATIAKPDDMLGVVVKREAKFERLVPAAESRLKKEFLPEIQKFAAVPINENDFHIRGMRIVNSKRDFYYSKFAPRALDEVAALLPGAPVMAAHQYGTLPLGTFFAAQKVFRRDGPKMPRRDGYWVEALFYVVADEEGDRIVRRIDLGNYREVSLGWRFVRATCELCNQSIWECPHLPGEVYDEGIADYRMSGIVDVLEGSMVFRGGQKGTHMFDPAQRSFEVSGLLRNALSPQEIMARKHAYAAGDQEQRNFFFKVPKPGLRARVQSVIGSRDRFDSMSEAAQWAREQSFTTDDASEGGDGYRFNQFELGKDASVRSVRLDDGVTGLVVNEKTQQGSASKLGPEEGEADTPSHSADHSFEEWLAGD